MKEEWLFPNAIVPVDVETTAALVAEIHRLIGVVGGMALAQPEQEPVAWADHGVVNWIADKQFRHAALLYEAPQRKPLTHKQRFDLLTKFEPHKHEWHAPAILIDMVEQAHGIKENT